MSAFKRIGGQALTVVSAIVVVAFALTGMLLIAIEMGFRPW